MLAIFSEKKQRRLFLLSMFSGIFAFFCLFLDIGNKFQQKHTDSKSFYKPTQIFISWNSAHLSIYKYSWGLTIQN